MIDPMPLRRASAAEMTRRMTVSLARAEARARESDALAREMDALRGDVEAIAAALAAAAERPGPQDPGRLRAEMLRAAGGIAKAARRGQAAGAQEAA